jgi:hypothetical protein
MYVFFNIILIIIIIKLKIKKNVSGRNGIGWTSVNESPHMDGSRQHNIEGHGVAEHP